MLRADISFFDIYSKVYISLVVDLQPVIIIMKHSIFSLLLYYGFAAAAAMPGTILPKIEWPLAT